MDKGERAANIQNAAEKFADAIEQVCGDKTRVGAFYCYLDDESEEWYWGRAGNLNMLERLGVLDFFSMNEKANINSVDEK